MLNSLYIKALYNRENIYQPVEDEEEVHIGDKWTDYAFSKSRDDFSIAAGDGSFNKKKFLSSNYCAVGAESLIYDGELKKIEYSDIFDIAHVSFLDELLSRYMSIFELKSCLKTIKEYDVDFYLFDGSIFGDLQNPYPMGAKFPSDIKNTVNGEVLNLFNRLCLDLSNKGLAFPKLRKKLFLNKDKDSHDYNLYLASIERLLLLKEILMENKKIISISKTSTSDDIFKKNIPDIAVFDKYTQNQGISQILYKNVSKDTVVTYPVEDKFFKQLWFTIFYLRLSDNRNVLKVELPYKASDEEIYEIAGKIKRDSAEGYPYLLKKAHNDVVITNKNMDELLKISRVYETTNREQLKM